jgi:hypothetical protein
MHLTQPKKSQPVEQEAVATVISFSLKSATTGVL